MKNETMFSYELLFGDHMAKVSHQAKLYYVKLSFFAKNGFVANPMSVLDSLGFDKSVFNELVKNGEILTLPNRSEVFITSYFVHNHFSPKTWLNSPFAQYWKGKLWTKPNGVATFNPQGEDKATPTSNDPMPNIKPPEKTTKQDWDNLFPEDKEEKGDDENADLPF